MIYRDRIEAGKRLVERLATYADRADVLVLALPRGGVPVAFEVARALRAPLDIFLVRRSTGCQPVTATKRRKGTTWLGSSADRVWVYMGLRHRRSVAPATRGIPA